MAEDKKLEDILKGAGVGYDPLKPQGEKCSTAPQVTPDEKMAGAMVVIRDSWGELNSGDYLPALDSSVCCKRIEDAVKLIRTELLIEQANREFKSLMINAAQKTLVVDGATLKRYTYPQKYDYPPNIVALEEQLKREKKTAEADGSATVIKRAESTTDTIFTITT